MSKRRRSQKEPKQRKELSGLALWYELHLRGKVSLFGLAFIAVALGVAYFVGVLPENVAGLGLAALLILAACGYAGVALLQASRSNLEGGAALSIAAFAAVISLGPVFSTLLPGKPIAHGVLSAPGDSLPLPEQARRIRVLLHVDFGAVTVSSLDLVLDAGAGSMTGHVERAVNHGRIGRSGQATMVDEHSSIFLDGAVGSKHALTVAELQGNAGGGVEVSVFRQWWPFGLECAVAAVLLLLAAVAAGRLGLGAPPVAAVGAALLFGILVYVMATPDRAIRSEVGALMVGALAGTVAGGTLGWLSRKLVGRRRAPQS